jgi:hypothetical protein
MQPTTITIDTADPAVSQAVARIAETFHMEPDVAEVALARFLVNVVDEILRDPERHCDDRQSNHRHDWKRIADIATAEKRERRGLWAGVEQPPLVRVRCCEPSDPCDPHDPCPLHIEAAARFLGTQVPVLGDTALTSAGLPAELEF